MTAEGNDASFSALVSQSVNPSACFARGTLKDQFMKKIRSCLLALAGALVVSTATATTITENFTTDPAADGWQIFGDASLFQWDPTNQVLDVTWDSTQPNSYFYHPLGTILGSDDDFQVSFDLQFSNIVAGVNPDKPDALEVGVGFLNFGQATNGIVRASPAFPPAYPDPQNIVEFDYFPEFTDPDFGFIAASIAPTMISSDYPNSTALLTIFLR